MTILLSFFSGHLMAQVHGCCSLYKVPFEEQAKKKLAMDSFLSKLEDKWHSCIDAKASVKNIQQFNQELLKLTMFKLMLQFRPEEGMKKNEVNDQFICPRPDVSALSIDSWRCMFTPDLMIELKSIISPQDTFYSYLVLFEKMNTEEAKLTTENLDLILQNLQGQ